MRDLINKILNEDFNKVIDEDFNVIIEAFKTPIPVELKKTNYGYEGFFNIESNVYTITIEKTCDGECYLFKFNMNDSFDMVGDVRKAFSVIPTIKKVVEDFISEHRPNFFIFLKTDTSKSRERFYNEFSNELSKKWGYKLSIKQIPNSIVIYMLANNLNHDDYTNTLIYLSSRYGNII